jgi:hypothetical protein
MRRHVAACLVAVAASGARSAKQRGFEGYDKTDPFGEKMAWDNDIAYAKMKSVDVEALVSSFRSDDVQSTHFGPDWARLPTLARAAVSRVKTHPNDKAAPMQTTLDGDSVSATAPSMRYSAAMLAGMPQSYEEMVSAFEMVGVDGRMLLNDVMPCDMFKEMRKWHNRGRHERPNAAEMLVQETIMLCYPYGK